MKIVISGYYGFGNLGDELILANIIQVLSEYKDSLVVLSQNPAQTQRQHQVRAVSRWNPWILWQEISNCQVLISGGGGLLQDLSGPFTPAYYLSLIALAQGLRKKTILLAQGFGPLRRFWNKALAKWIVRKADQVIPRDAEGYYWCTKNGVPAGRLVPGSDLVWLMPRDEQPGVRRWVVCLRADWLGHLPPSWIRDLAAYAQARKTIVRFVALGNRGDHRLLQRMQLDSDFQGCEFWPEPVLSLDPKNIQKAFLQAELVISMRYHGLLLGALAGAAVTGLGNDEKIKYILQALEQPELKINDTQHSWDALCHTLPVLQERVRYNTKKLQQIAQAGVQHMLNTIRA